jgi:hypothetical protein
MSGDNMAHAIARLKGAQASASSAPSVIDCCI